MNEIIKISSEFIGIEKVNSVNAIDCAIKGKIQKQAYDFLWTSQTNVKVFNNAAKTKNL